MSTTDAGKGALIVEADGRVVMAGLCEIAPGGAANRAVCLARVLIDGAADATFGSNGLAIGVIGVADKRVTGLARQADGKYVVSSICEDLTGYYFCVRRFMANGSVDTSFGVAGAANLAPPSSSVYAFAYKISAHRDGTLMVVGLCDVIAERRICLLRLLSNGQPDPSFGVSGYVRLSLEPTIRGFSNGVEVNLLPNGKVQLATLCELTGGAQYCIVQLNAAGALDTTFNSAGPLPGVALNIQTINYNASVSAMAIRGDGSMLLAVRCSRFSPTAGPIELCLESFIADGRIDTNFGLGGELRIPPPDPASQPRIPTSSLNPAQLLPLPDGRFLLSGSCGTAATASPPPCINRHRADGTLDATFTPAVFSVVPAPYADSSGLGVQPSGKIVMGGVCNAPSTAGNPLKGFCITRIQAGPFDYAQCGTDIDGDGAVTVNDSLLLSRAALGFAGSAVLQSIAFATHAQRNTWPKIRDYLFNQCGMQVAP